MNDQSTASRGRRAGRLVADAARLVAALSIPLAFALDGAEGAVRFVLVLLVLLVPRRIGVPAPVDAAFAVALLLAAWAGAAGWYDAAWWLDVVMHFVTTGTTAGAAYLILVRVPVLVRPELTGPHRRGRRLVLLVVALGLAIGALWELYEWAARNWLGNTSIHVGYDDTILDLTMDGLGSLTVGLILLVTLPRMEKG